MFDVLKATKTTKGKIVIGVTDPLLQGSSQDIFLTSNRTKMASWF